MTVVDGAVASGGVRITCPVHSILTIAGPDRVPVHVRLTSSAPATPLGFGGFTVTEFTVTIETRLKYILLNQLIIIFF